MSELPSTSPHSEQLAHREPTADFLLRTAERLFAERGLAGVSLRQIAVAAGQRNPAVVQYHFGSKDDLVRAIIESRTQVLDARRFELMSGPRLSGLEEMRRIVRAILLPLVELGSDTHYVRFLANLAASPRELAEAFSQIDDRNALGRHSVEHSIHLALAHLPEPIRDLRIAMATRLVLDTLAVRNDGKGMVDDGLTDELFVANLVEATVGLLVAPVPH